MKYRNSTTPLIRSFSNAGLALCALSLGAACGASDGDGTTDGGATGDGSGSADGGGSVDGHATTDGEGPVDGRIAADGGVLTAPIAVNLGMAGDYVILAMSGISTVPTSAITGDLGISPAPASYITAFALNPDSTNVFSTSSQVTGKVYASNYAVPTPANLTAAISDMQLAYTDASGRAPDFTELGAGDIGGMTLAQGVYKWGTALDIPTDVTLTGSATDVWIFEVAQNLTTSNGVRISLTGGAVPKNVFWQIAGFTTIGTTAHFEGIVLCQTQITMETGASINGRLLAQTAVNIASSTVVAPAP